MPPRHFTGGGPLLGAGGILFLLRTGLETSYLGAVPPAMLVFALGLSLTVAPLTATVLADADEQDAGTASAINNAVARVAGLIGVSVLGVVVAQTLVGDTFPRTRSRCGRFTRSSSYVPFSWLRAAWSAHSES